MKVKVAISEVIEVTEEMVMGMAAAESDWGYYVASDAKYLTGGLYGEYSTRLLVVVIFRPAFINTKPIQYN